MSELARLVTVTGTTQTPISRNEAKAWLKIEEEDVADDALLDALIVTATDRYETHAQKALIRKTFDEYFDCTPKLVICVRRSPLVSVTSIRGFSDTDATDTGGTAMSSSGYYVDVASEPGRIVPFSGFMFPTATRRVNGAIVRYVAGYSTSTTGIPDQAKTTIKRMVARAYEFRGDAEQQDAAMQDVLTDDLALPEWG